MIVFNALQTSLNGGIGRYSYELAKELYKTNNTELKLVIRIQDLERFSFVKKSDLIIVENINNSRDRNIYEQFRLPKIIREKYPNAIIHYPDTMAPLLSKNPVVITVHDLAFKSVKGAFTWKSKLWKNFITDLSIKKADKIIAITNFTKTEIEKHYPKINKDKIQVVYNGFNNFSNEEIDEDQIREEIKELNKPYILTVSTISPRKNIDGLIRAFDMKKNHIKENLVIAGGNGWMFEEVYNLVESLNLQDRIKFTGKVNDEELKYLYKNAKIFTYVSFYEGFGLPPLEAMSYGIPCIVSNKSSLPEVVGESSVMIDPNDIEKLAEEMLKLLNSENNTYNFKDNLSRFSWNNCAKEVFNLYKQFKKSNTSTE